MLSSWKRKRVRINLVRIIIMWRQVLSTCHWKSPRLRLKAILGYLSKSSNREISLRNILKNLEWRKSFRMDSKNLNLKSKFTVKVMEIFKHLKSLKFILLDKLACLLENKTHLLEEVIIKGLHQSQVLMQANNRTSSWEKHCLWEMCFKRIVLKNISLNRLIFHEIWPKVIIFNHFK